jgi:hypothetical protein
MNLPRLAVTSCRRRMPRAVPPSGDLWDQMTRTGLETDYWSCSMTSLATCELTPTTWSADDTGAFAMSLCRNGDQAEVLVQDLRKKRHTLSGWVTPRFFTFARGASLAAAVAVAVLTLLLAPANACRA